jgi:urease accessory protein UreH
VRVAPGARVVLTSQAALQIHPAAPSSGGSHDAILQSRFVVEDDAELHCHWDPVIPFADARLDQRFDVDLAESSRFYWSDAIMSGRISRGEVWRFARLAHDLSLRVAGALHYLERYALVPAERTVERAWVAGSAHYFATTLVWHRGATADLVECWQRDAASCSSVRSAVDLAAPGLIAARVASADGAAFARMRTYLRARALDDIFRAPELAGRK